MDFMEVYAPTIFTCVPPRKRPTGKGADPMSEMVVESDTHAAIGRRQSRSTHVGVGSTTISDSGVSVMETGGGASGVGLGPLGLVIAFPKSFWLGMPNWVEVVSSHRPFTMNRKSVSML